MLWVPSITGISNAVHHLDMNSPGNTVWVKVPKALIAVKAYDDASLYLKSEKGADRTPNVHCRNQYRGLTSQRGLGSQANTKLRPPFKNKTPQRSPLNTHQKARLEILILTLHASTTDNARSNFGTDCSFFCWAPDEGATWLAFRGNVVWKICIFKH